MAILETKGITKNFGGLTAVRDVSFQIEKGEIIGLIGPNGSGKTTLINMISGFLKPTAGEVIFQEQKVTGLKPHLIAKRGIARSFQLTTIFRETSVMNSMRVAFHLHSGVGFWPAVLNTRSTMRKEAEVDRKVMETLEFLGIAETKNELCKNLPHGYERLLGVGMAISTGASMLLLDEPVTGMNPKEAMEMVSLIGKLKEKGLTILIVEHNMKVMMSISDRIVALNFGQKIFEGKPDEAKADKQVIEAYLGS